jgi:uncharacterized membrane-anchored protein
VTIESVGERSDAERSRRPELNAILRSSTAEVNIWIAIFRIQLSRLPAELAAYAIIAADFGGSSSAAL